MPSRIVVPQLPNPPKRLEDLERWASDFTREIVRYFNDQEQLGTDSQLIGRVEDQTISDGFTLAPNSPKIGLHCTAAVTSAVDVAIKAGSNGQTIEVHNQSSFNITFKNGAQIRCTGNVDLVMLPNDVVQFHWDLNQRLWVQIGTTGTHLQAQIDAIIAQL